MKKSDSVRIITHVPKDALQAVQKAIWDAWGWVMWKYSHCSFVMEWIWFFTPWKWSNPTIWNIGVPETLAEYHLEFTCERENIKKVVQALKKAHPYEEVPIFIHECLEY